MKLTTTTKVSVDGVMQGLGGADEDRRDGFERGGWAMPYTDDETMGFLNEVYGRADSFLFGRGTYEIFAGSWGTWERSGRQPDLDGVEHTAQVRGIDHALRPEWANTTVLSGDVAAAIRGLKAEAGGELLVPGSGVLVRWLLDNDLVDEIHLLTFPVVVGEGTRLFPDSGPDIALELVGSQAVTSRGVTIQVYRPAGRPQYGTVIVTSIAHPRA